jgi:hypothetical protein
VSINFCTISHGEASSSARSSWKKEKWILQHA